MAVEAGALAWCWRGVLASRGGLAGWLGQLGWLARASRAVDVFAIRAG